MIGADKLTAKNNAVPAYDGKLTTSRGIHRVAVGIHSCTMAVGGIVVGGMGRNLSEALGRRGMEMSGRGVGDLLCRTAISREVYMGR